ncbi:MATE family efflux transporter [Halocatena salina]|uniref:MATE family efflux transporter n=1 Tax=Halocatena salina TaxID=2934340 RepID=A0A8T9ZZR6_9EURY|nr:MATE family efflux transporter [Halocatena salina]UPM42331.1 MATE family efflux transporter [Halocatena salina]
MSTLDELRRLFVDPTDDLDLTAGPVGKPLLYLSAPIIVTNLLQTAYNLADTFWLGQYSTTALAAISFAFPMVFLLFSLALGVSVAGSVLVAQHIGADQEDNAEYAASQTVTFSLIASVLLGGIGYVFVDEYLVVLGATDSVIPPATAYMKTISLGLFAMFGFAVFISLMRGYGDTVTPMLVMFGSVVLNIVLDPILIFGFADNPLFGHLGLNGVESVARSLTGFTGSGIEGAAIATVFSRLLAFVVGLAIMFRGERGVEIHLRQMIPDLGYGRQFVDLGVPASVEGTGVALSTNVLLFILAAYPESVVAAYGIGTRVFSVVFLPAIAFSQGIETMTGQNIGAGKHDRAERTNHYGARVMAVVLTVLGVVAFFRARSIAAVFTTDTTVIDATATFMQLTALTFGGTGVRRAYLGGFRGAGKTLTAAVITVAVVGIQLPLAWLGSIILGTHGIWLSFAVANVFGALLAFVWFQHTTRSDSLSEQYEKTTVTEPATDD